MKFSTLFILLLFVTGVSRATDYYVSSTGSNSNNGTSQTTPWQTLSKVESVCNAGTILPGDRILFKKGDAFTGSVIIGSIWGKRAKSGTAANPITFGTYGTGAKPLFLYPTGGSTNVTSRITMTVVGVDYYIFDGLHFTDLNTTNDKIAPANCGMALYLGAEGEATTNHCTVQNVDVSLCGMGIVLIGDFNKVTGCSLTNFKNLKSTNGGDDDYGANALTIISGDDNEISNNYIAGAWSASLDYGWNGGACEIFNSCHRNKLMYNTFYDCGGISEFGAYETNATANDNVIAYNKIINCGTATWINTTGNFAIQVSNLQYYNNVIIENNASRFSGPNTGLGLTPQYQALIGPEVIMFAYSGSPSAQNVFVVKNNVLHLTTGIDVVRSNDSKTLHTNNVYKLSGGSAVNVSLHSSEVNTTAAVFAGTTQADPISWNYTPAPGSPVLDRGVNVGIAKDFVGNNVPNIPNAGILESATGGSTLSATSTPGAISCFGGSTTVTVAASGGTAPYTGTGTFTVSAGTYNYTVTDNAGGSVVTSVTVVQPTAVSATVVAGTAPSPSGTATATVSASGGTPTYTYSLDGGTYQSASTFQNVSVGSHSITVRDGKACTATKSFNVSAAGSSPLIITAVSGSIACNGGNTTVTLSATGGKSPYTGTGTFTVTAGTYTYSVTDASGITGSYTITVTQPSAISVDASATAITTAGGTSVITTTATGGTAPYTYQLGTASFQSSNVFTGVAAGTYAITVKDSRGCTAVKSITITATQTGTLAIYLISQTNNSCRWTWDGTITVGATGGTAPYYYSINNYGYGTRNTFINLGPATYTVRVKDATGAISSMTVKILRSTKSCSNNNKPGNGTEPAAEKVVAPISGLDIQAYPNPTASEFTLVINSEDIQQPAQVVVMNLNGQKVYQGIARPNQKLNFGSNFISGTYIVKITQGNTTETRKLVKAK